jgi:hypothetical protein
MKTVTAVRSTVFLIFLSLEDRQKPVVTGFNWSFRVLLIRLWTTKVDYVKYNVNNKEVIEDPIVRILIKIP